MGVWDWRQWLLSRAGRVLHDRKGVRLGSCSFTRAIPGFSFFLFLFLVL